MLRRLDDADIVGVKQGERAREQRSVVAGAQTQYSLRNGASVALFCVTSYCSRVRRATASRLA